MFDPPVIRQRLDGFKDTRVIVAGNPGMDPEKFEPEIAYLTTNINIKAIDFS